MKILVLSDSHSSLSFMRLCVSRVKPDVLMHLGDYFDDGQVIHEEYPDIPFYQVPGNCDRYRCAPGQPETLIVPLGGVRFFLTHGHKFGVKMGTDRLLAVARNEKANAVLYGHTHWAECFQEPDGLWVLNPGSCGSYGGSAGILVVKDGTIASCHVIKNRDLEDLK